jgi:hypothetical protein
MSTQSIMAQLPNQIIMDIIKKSTELKRQPFIPVLEQIRQHKGIKGDIDGEVGLTSGWISPDTFGVQTELFYLFWTAFRPENFQAEFEFDRNGEYEPMEDDHPESILYIWGDFGE